MSYKKIVTISIVLFFILITTLSIIAAIEKFTINDYKIIENQHVSVEIIKDNTISSNKPEVYKENIVTVQNTGNISTFNRIFIAVPAYFSDYFDFVYGNQWELKEILYNQLYENEVCNIYVLNMKNHLSAGDISSPAIWGIHLKDDINANDISELADNEIQFKYIAQAVQSKNMGSYKDAFSYTDRTENPWNHSLND